MPTNAERREWAKTALRAFAKARDGDTDELKADEDAVVADLICDLMHLHAETNSDPAKSFARLVEEQREKWAAIGAPIIGPM